jgi:hypothetical protein
MEWRAGVRGLVTVLIAGTLLAGPASAQITTGTVAGEIKDEQGLPVPGATVTVVNEARGTLQVRSLADPTPTNLSRDASGNLINSTGFGAVTAVSPARQIQLMARFHF